MPQWQDDPDHPIPSRPKGPPAPGLEGYPRVDSGAVEESVPTLIDRAIRGPVVLTRHGEEAFVLLPLDIYRRLWAAAPRPPLLDPDPPEKP
jgi:hypothetical protein